jgi:hypothetical protein
MAVSVTFNGNSYVIPSVNEVGWSIPVTGIIQDLGLHAVDTNTSQNIGGAKTFTANITLTGGSKVISFASTGIADNAVGLALTLDTGNNAIIANNLTVTGTTTLTTPLSVTSGGTGANTAANARTNLGLGTAATQNTGTSGATLPFLNAVNTWSAAQRATITTLTDGATITPDFSLTNNYLVTIAGNRTLANPTNLVGGQSGFIIIVQDATGSRTLTYGSNYKFQGATVPVLTTSPNATDVFSYFSTNAGAILMSPTLAWG